MSANQHKENLIDLWTAWDDLFYRITETEEWNAECYSPYCLAISEYQYSKGTIDGVLFFEDGTIEFHIKEDRDAYNWTAFPSEVIAEVLRRATNSISMSNN